MYLPDTINSLICQSYKNIEIICVNDHSTDNTIDVLQQFNNKIKIYSSTKKGASAARNFAFFHSVGEYVVFLDADDIVTENYIESMLTHCRNDSAFVVVSKWGRFFKNDISTFKEDHNIIKKDLDFYNWILGYWTFNNHTTPPGRVFIPRTIVNNSGGWNEDLSLNDDLDFYSRVFSLSSSIIYNDDACLFYRSGIGGLSSKIKGHVFQLSNMKSIENATSLVVSQFPDDYRIKRACANMWQLFIYSNYPENKDLLEYAYKRIKELGGSDYLFQAGGITKVLAKIIG